MDSVTASVWYFTDSLSVTVIRFSRQRRCLVIVVQCRGLMQLNSAEYDLYTKFRAVWFDMKTRIPNRADKPVLLVTRQSEPVTNAPIRREDF